VVNIIQKILRMFFFEGFGKLQIYCLSVLIFFVGMFTAEANALPDLVEKVGPSVVSIQSQVIKKDNQKAPKKKSKSLTSGYATALGTGFIVLKEEVVTENPSLNNFLVLTNYHVVEGAEKVEVVTLQKKVIPAKIVGRDPRNDIAVLRIEMPSDTPVLKLKSSRELRVGESLFAIGNPYGLSNTVTSGILSAKDRSLGVGSIDRYLQTNVDINFGNSGGPLFDYTGQVVGITTLSKTDSQGLGFAIPSDTVLRLLPRLAEGESLKRGWLGISILPANRALSEHFKNFPIAFSKVPSVTFFVVGVQTQSPAAKIGLQKGDLILSLLKGDSEFVFSKPFDLKDSLDALKPGDSVELKIQRSSEKIFKARLTLAPAPEESEFYEYD
jgi:serine protease Do